MEVQEETPVAVSVVVVDRITLFFDPVIDPATGKGSSVRRSLRANLREGSFSVEEVEVEALDPKTSKNKPVKVWQGGFTEARAGGVDIPGAKIPSRIAQCLEEVAAYIEDCYLERRNRELPQSRLVKKG